MKIKKGDTVKIIAGKDRGKTGKVTHAFPEMDKVVVDGVNLHKKHMRPKKQGQKGQIIQKPSPIHISNVMFMCQACGEPARVGGKKVGDRKIRVCKKCNGEIK